MSTVSSQEEQIRLKVSPDEMYASLEVTQGLIDGEQLLAMCLTELRSRNVQINKSVEQQVAEQLRPLSKPDVGAVTIELRGRPPKPGDDGRLEWAQGCAPPDKHAVAPGHEADSDQAIDYYNQRKFITVTAGQPVLRIVPPTDGDSGVTLSGKDLPSKAGQPVKIRVDPNSVVTEADGTCTAVIDGLLKFDGQKLSISPHLEIHGHVDFSTGNIDFQGDVQIGKGIRDCFIVRANGNVIVDGPIESAGIETGGDLHANRGIACHSPSSIIVGRNLQARYLDTAHVCVKGSANVEREVIQSKLTVGDSLTIEHGSLIGGITCVGRKVSLANIGSDAEVITTLYMAHDPSYAVLLQRTEEYLDYLQTKLKKVTDQLTQIQQLGGRGDHAADMLTELMCDKYNLETQFTRLRTKYEKLNDCYQKRRRADLDIAKQIHAGVRLIIDDQEIRVTRPIRGPIWIGWDKQRKLVYRTGDHGTTVPLKDIPGLEIMPSKSPCPDMTPPQMHSLSEDSEDEPKASAAEPAKKP
ncbi:DUF342 domain-containing protein [Planctomycetales bacterium ZRK34]|nr:DUF342 domain-containing protein [Planctomycetales bacterium ZRK34]